MQRERTRGACFVDLASEERRRRTCGRQGSSGELYQAQPPLACYATSASGNAVDSTGGEGAAAAAYLLPEGERLYLWRLVLV